MKKIKKTKGFTLVELLVVIAILAVLATVSVVGYTSFIGKANNSNALTECKQAEDIVLSDLISTGKEVDAIKEVKDGDTSYVKFTYAVSQGKVGIEFSNIADGEVVDITGGVEKTGYDDISSGMNDVFTDTVELDGRFYAVVDDSDFYIAYITANEKGIAIWRNQKNPESGTAGQLETLLGIIHHPAE